MTTKLNGVVEIDEIIVGKGEFHGKEITKVIISDRCEIIDNCAFQNCAKLENVTFGKNLRTIQRDAFAGCTSLDSITLPEGLERIGSRAFVGCTALASITIPASVKSIHGFAFRDLQGTLLIKCESGSAAYWFAIANGFTVEAVY